MERLTNKIDYANGEHMLHIYSYKYGKEIDFYTRNIIGELEDCIEKIKPDKKNIINIKEDISDIYYLHYVLTEIIGLKSKEEIDRFIQFLNVNCSSIKEFISDKKS